MRKFNKKMLFGAFILLVIVSGAVFVLSRGGEDGGRVNPVAIVTGRSGFPADTRDAAVYAVIENYIRAQAENQRNAVVEMLTEEHRSEWGESSFLLTEKAAEYFDEIKLGDIRMGVIGYENNGTDAYVRVSYYIDFVKDGKVETTAGIEEALAFSNENGKWLIGTSIRSVAAAN